MSILYLLLFLLVIVKINLTQSMCPELFKNQTDCSCFTYIDGIVIRCNGINGPSIIEQLKDSNFNVEIRELALENANIVEVGNNAFGNIRVKKIILDNNKIRKINRYAFSSLETTLQELSIANNRLTKIPVESLAGLKSLNILNLKCNLIGNIDDYVLYNLTNLIDLNLSCNKICEINTTAFNDMKDTLQNLILDYNCLASIPTNGIRNLGNLIAIHLKYNEIVKLGSNQLMNMPSLTILTLTGNEISEIDEDFMTGAENLKYLYLGKNKIANLSTESIKQFNQVQILDLSNNRLTEITENMFTTLGNLQHINLDGNLIKDIAPGAFATTPLLLLWLPNNCLTSISSKIFQGVPFLRQVSLANNNIHDIAPLSFAHLANLHTLDLSHNKIETLGNEAIIGSDHLTIRFQENPMVCSQDGFHVMNGHDAINLTIEPNLICKTDYIYYLNADKCPKNNLRENHASIRKQCCHHNSKEYNDKNGEDGEESLIQLIEEDKYNKDKNVDRDVDENSYLVGESEENTSMFTASGIITVNSTETSMKKKINLERFHKLSQRGNDKIQSKHIHSLMAKSHILTINETQRQLSAGVNLLKVRKYKVPSRIEERQRFLERTNSESPTSIRLNSKKPQKNLINFSRDDSTVESIDEDLKP